MLTLDYAYRYLIGLPAEERGECPCGYPERWLAPSRLDVAGRPVVGFAVVCPFCGTMVAGIVETR